MSILLKEEDFREAIEQAKTRKLTSEQKQNLEELGRKMRARLSREDLNKLGTGQIKVSKVTKEILKSAGPNLKEVLFGEDKQKPETENRK